MKKEDQLCKMKDYVWYFLLSVYSKSCAEFTNISKLH
jgi:hypothetical protein